jgi:hypothetical protein
MRPIDSSLAKGKIVAANKKVALRAPQKPRYISQLRATLVAMSGALTLAACSSIGGSGPSSARINSSAKESYAGNGISIVDLNKSALSRINSVQEAKSFAALLAETPALNPVIGAGDVLDVSVWEAPPSILFGSIEGGSSQNLGAQNRTVLQQVVSTDGTMAIPFVGRISVDGMAPAALEREIVRRLAKRANDPQVVVKIAQNEARNVTIFPLAPAETACLIFWQQRVVRASQLAKQPCKSRAEEQSQSCRSKKLLRIQDRMYGW